MKMILKKIVLMNVLVASVALTACSGNNPLESEPHDKVLTFLEAASISAEKNLKIKAFPAGITYVGCMMGNGKRGTDKDSHLCDSLYKEMIVYAKTTNGPFKDLTLSELQDQRVFEMLQDMPLNNR